MDSGLHSTWELALKTLTPLALVVAAVWGYHTYTDTKEKEFYSAFWNQKLSLFLETSAAASTMATTESVDEFNKARTKYRELFYGRLSLVEGDNVKKAMQTFAPGIPRGPMAQKDLPLVSLQQPAYKLTVALKEELGTAWRSPFSELQKSGR